MLLFKSLWKLKNTRCRIKIHTPPIMAIHTENKADICDLKIVDKISFGYASYCTKIIFGRLSYSAKNGKLETSKKIKNKNIIRT